MKPGAVQMGRNEPCPCGSGKRYMDCCLNTKYLITYNYNNQAVLIDKNKINKNLRMIITLNKSLNRFRKRTFQEEAFNVDHAIEYLKRVYEIIDLSLTEVEKFASCSKGCNACCDTEPITTWIEAEYIKRYLKDELSKEELKIKVKALQENLNKGHCPLLSQSGQCCIYEARPVKCRSYLVFSDPRDCSDEDKEPLRFSDAILDLAESTAKKISLFLDDEDSTIIYKKIGHWFDSTV